MSKYQVVRYTSDFYSQWNLFVEGAKNATFMFHRDFMEYHADRFEDFSLLFFKKNSLVSIMPLNRVNDTVFSHQGLSYGGLVLSKKSTLKDALKTFEAILWFLKDLGIKTVILKPVPRIYNTLPSDEIDYVLFKLKAELFRKDITTVVHQFSVSRIKSLNRQRNLKKGRDLGLVVKETDCFEDFWSQILIPNLKAKFNVSPVHSLEEITLLKKSFPNHIRQFNAYHEDDIVAGITIFETENVAHAQYISKHPIKNFDGGLDVILDYLINKVYKNKRFFDFGISNEGEGQFINDGLQSWKESFGGRSVSHDFYNINVDNCKLLENVFV